MKKLWMVPALLFLAIFLPVNAQAAGAGFTMSALQPENQLSDTTYFDLQVSPNQTQDLSIQVTNQEDQAITLQISPNPAFTNSNGVIEYSQYDYPKDSSAQYTFSELVSDPQEVQLAPQESKTVTFQLTVPNDPFSGSILGGFYAQQIDTDDTTTDTTASSDSEMLTIKNKYSLLLGASLTEDPNQEVSPELQLNDVKAGLADQRTAVLANLQNIQPQSFGGMTVDAKIFKKGDSEVLKETTKENQEMAPNSNYDFAITWENQPLEAGDYQLKIHAISGSKAWDFERDFTITGAEAKAINEKAVDLPEPNYWWIYLLLGILLLILILILVYYLGRKKGQQGSR